MQRTRVMEFRMGMATLKRLAENSDQGDETESRGLMSAGATEHNSDSVIEMDLLPPRWAEIENEVAELLANITIQSQKLEELQQKYGLPGYDEEEMDKRDTGDTKRLSQSVTSGFKGCQKAIQGVGRILTQCHQQGGMGKRDEALARNVQISLAGRVQEACSGFQKQQIAYLESEYFNVIVMPLPY
jgi:syntaxin 16